MKPKLLKSLIRQSHERQFNGEDWQAVSNDLCEEHSIDWETDEHQQLMSSPDPGCDCGFCEKAPWRA